MLHRAVDVVSALEHLIWHVQRSFIDLMIYVCCAAECWVTEKFLERLTTIESLVKTVMLLT